MTSSGFGQPFQNPYWVLAGNPPNLLTNPSPPNASPLPFTTPVTGTPTTGLNPYQERYNTAVNGVFDECGNPIFYIAGDWLFDEDGMQVGYLKLKDRWSKYDDPNDGLYPNPYTTENFESVICENPNVPGRYFIFCSDQANSSGTTIWVYEYDVPTKYLLPGPEEIEETNFTWPGVRWALSKVDSISGGRNLYTFNGRKIFILTISPFAISAAGVGAIPLVDFNNFEMPCSELELSHDQSMLAWASFDGQRSVIHFYDLLTSTHKSFEPAPDVIHYISGLEFLPDGRLVVSIEWNSPLLQNLNGLGYFNISLTNFTPIQGSGDWVRSMVELGISNTNVSFIYANNGNRVVQVPFSGSSPATISSVIPVQSAGYISYFYGLINVNGALPDHVDGLEYPFSIDCEGGNGSASGEFSGFGELTEEITPYTFSPIINITHHEK